MNKIIISAIIGLITAVLLIIIVYYTFFVAPTLSIKINGITYNLNVETDLVRLEGQKLFCEQDNILELITISDKYKIYANNKEVIGNKPVPLRINSLASGNYINIRVRKIGTENDFQTDISTLPNAYRGIFTTSLSHNEGYYYFTLRNAIYKMNSSGDIVYFNKTEKPVLGFQPHEINGKMFYSYLASYGDFIFEPQPGFERNSMYVVILDENYQKYNTILGLMPTKKVGPNGILAINGFHLIDEDHYILFGTTNKEVNNIPTYLPQNPDKKSLVAATIIQEIKNGELIFEWDSTDYPELYELGYEFNDYTNKSIDIAVYTFLNNLIINPKNNN